jgi:RNA 3'-terminal phosphate cyclase (ATP)
MHTIDGSYGEGGGQILRTSLALAATLGLEVTIGKIRAARKNPGLAPQHLLGVKALAAIAGAQVEGAQLGSTSIIFRPQKVRGGDYTFEVGTAGSVSLVFQTLALPLAWADIPTTLRLTGGTHVPWSPHFPYLKEVLLPTLSQMGYNGTGEIRRWGWYPRGGGEVFLTIAPTPFLGPLELEERGPLKAISGHAVVSNIPRDIALREIKKVKELLCARGLKASLEAVEAPAWGQGNAIFLKAEFENSRAGFSALGERGKRAEVVAQEAAEELLSFLEGPTALEAHLADQLIPFMALAKGRSSFTVNKITEHLLTNLWVVQQLTGASYQVRGEKGEIGQIAVEGINYVKKS